MNEFLLQYRNAKKAIKQIRAGEWVPEYNPYSREHLTACRGDLELWIENGAFSCEARDRNYVLKNKYFGLFWRHYVWWAAARKMKCDAEIAYEKANNKILILPD
jgi:hypothetical protein